MFNVKTIPNPADAHYNSGIGAGPVPTFENAKSIFVGKQLLVNLYAFNSSGATVYLAVCDTPNNTFASATKVTIYPIPTVSFLSLVLPGGDRIEGGLFLQAFTDVGLTAAAGNVMHYKVDWDAYVGFIA